MSVAGRGLACLRGGAVRGSVGLHVLLHAVRLAANPRRHHAAADRPRLPAWAARSFFLPRREKIVQGRVDKIAKEMSLLDQQFIKDTNKTVAVSARRAGRITPLSAPHFCGPFLQRLLVFAASTTSSSLYGLVPPSPGSPPHLPLPAFFLLSSRPAGPHQGADCGHRREHPGPPL